MRILVAAILLLALPACTSMLLGNASSGGGETATDRRSSTQVAEDNTITATIRRRISADSNVGKYAIGIMTVGNIVTLSGTVGSFPARDRAVQIASDTAGVKSIQNRIMVNTNL